MAKHKRHAGGSGRGPGEAYARVIAERGPEIAVAKLLIESRIRLAQIGVRPLAEKLAHAAE